MFREAIGAGIAIIIVLVIWLNPGIVSGVTKSFTQPVKAWINNPDAVGSKMPWQINPEDVKKAAGKKSDSVAAAGRDIGETAKTTRDAGQSGDATKATPKRSRDIGETDPGYPSESPKSTKKADSTKKATKSRPSSTQKTYTKPTLGAHAVAVQRAQGL